MMIHITKAELKWIAEALRDRAQAAAARLDIPEESGLNKALYKMRSEQLASIAERMEKAAANGSKRIAID